jgi:hypothetical protein
MITLTLQSDRGSRWFRSRWDEDEDPFKVIDEDVSPAHAVDHIEKAAEHISDAMCILSDNNEEVVFNLRKYTNFEDFMTLENELGLMLAILIAKRGERASISFRSEKELVDVLGMFMYELISAVDVDDVPLWMQTLKDWFSCRDIVPASWHHSTRVHSFRICALAMNVLFGNGRKFNKPEYDKFGVMEVVE